MPSASSSKGLANWLPNTTASTIAPSTAMNRYSMPNLMPKGEGFTLRCMWANSQPDTLASQDATTNISSLWWKVEAPMASGMVLPPPRLTFSARITRPGREFSSRCSLRAPASAITQMSTHMARSLRRLRLRKVISGTSSKPSYLPRASRLPMV